ncbi:type II 3-dehydroquinate dehydratase [Azospira inquinata]|uniref:3-dehydroquinate dehydratase n=1 Tax=Azospira inquinata TaxID=2785627 RepID=A0A975SLE1_9RHOO|nr:type II 3-dehydroquinate dehydratase [Azospira inquinata]QWT46677.1 type II 3-dehydroquinate dehydratase [Azospira inquinata]QWT47999.1 type II 3-dehydroquinate dehydratase [Azospira inquinata]
MKKQTSQSSKSAKSGVQAEQLRILVLHGPNLNLLGTREPEIYGHTTLADINRRLACRAKEAGIVLESFQSNHEGALIECIHAARDQSVNAIIFNPAAYTHTSVAIRDALAGVDIPFVEVHLSNVFAREPFRHHSYFSDLAIGVISGLGDEGYALALEFLLNRLSPN